MIAMEQQILQQGKLVPVPFYTVNIQCELVAICNHEKLR